MKIAVPTSDKSNVSENTLSAGFFAVATIDESNITHIEYRENPETLTDARRRDIGRLLDDCEIVLFRSIENRLKSVLEEEGLRCRPTNSGRIGEAIHRYLSDIA